MCASLKSGAYAPPIKYLIVVLLVFVIELKMATKDQIEQAYLNATPGVSPKNTKFESYISHNVINLSNVQLSEHQVKALERGSHFAPG